MRSRSSTRATMKSAALLILVLFLSFGTLMSLPFSTSAAPGSFVRNSAVFTLSPGNYPTTITVGPDGRVYVATFAGRIYALTFDSNYNVVASQTILSIFNTPNFNDDGSPAPEATGRLALGITFDPASTASAPIMYVSHSDPRMGFAYDENALAIDTLSGTVTRLTGPNFDAPGNRLDVVTGLPRSRKNHGTNDIVFGPDGYLYIGQGGNTSLGAAHPLWTDLPEHYLSAAIVRANVRNISSPQYVGDVNSAAALQAFQGSVELYATGFRNLYDLVWHSNGSLYGNDNGSNPDQGTTPGPSHGCPDGAELNPSNMPDRFFKVTQGMYGGHPNPARGECILNAGTMYFPQKAPEPNYIPALHAYDYWGGAVSVNGIAEYPIGEMAGNLISTTFSGDQMLRRNVINANGSVTVATLSDVGPFNNPVDVAIDGDGVMYIAEYGLAGTPAISVLIPTEISGDNPVLSSLSPTTGSSNGGTVVTLGGSNFASGATVTFGGTPATQVTVNNSSSITATTPAHAAGPVTVSVANPDGQFSSLPNAFTYTSPSSGTSLLRVNSGGTAYTSSGGTTWSADSGFTGGGTYATSNTISGTTDQALYRSERYGNFSYSFSLDPGNYAVNLKFAEIYWTSPGQRIFDVAINGQTVLDNFDILANADPRAALDLSFPANVTSGPLTITFTTVQDNAKISAIEITGSSGGGDTTAPTVASTVPVNGATNVAVDSSINVTFSEPMHRASTETAFGLSPQPPPGTFSWNTAGTILTFEPFLAVRAFDYDREYTVSIAPTATDLAGNPLASEFAWTFTTVAQNDTTPPSVASTTPADGAVDVALNSGISLTFSEQMNQSATEASFEITPAINGSFSWDVSGTTMTFLPSAALSENTQYNANVSTEATDLAGNPLGAPTNWSFTTAEPEPEPAPTVSNVTPATGSTLGGTNLTITGTNFMSGASVTIGGMPATSVAVSNSTTITATTPAHAAGTVAVTVSNPDGQFSSLNNAFTYSAPSSGTSVVRVNSGGAAYSSSGTQWSADTGFTGGGTYATSNPISGTTDQALYRSERYGNFSYSFNVEPGDYTVNLKFAEIYWTAAGQRIFDVAINGQTVLDDFDIMATTATRTALDREFPVSVSSGPITITFTTVKDNAKISAIQITGGPGGGGGDTTAPTVASTLPANGASTVPVGNSISVTFSEAMNQSATQAAFGISPTAAGSFSWNGAGTVMTFDPTANLQAGQSYSASVGVGARDLAGNALGSATNWTFSTAQAADTQPPTVSGTSPANNATNVAINAAISVSFSEAMNKTATQSAFSIAPTVAGTFSWNAASTIMTFTPTANLAAGANYTATVGVGATDLAGNPLGSAVSWTFGTAQASDTQPPTVSSTSPAANATNVPLAATISVTFSEAMNKSATQAAFGITPTVAGAFTWNAAGTIMTFTPTANLAASTTYTVTVGVGAKDLAGNALGSALSRTFTTVAPTPGPAPVLTSINPTSGSTAGGTVVTLSGTNFVSGATVSFGGTAATNVTVTNSTTISATAPARAAGAVAVTVTNPDGQSGSLTNAFTYVAPSSGTSLLRINAGGGAFTSSSGTPWSADAGFSGGGTYSAGGVISGTADQTLYRSERHGNFSYSFNVEPGDYTVTLKFAEVYWTAAGQRTFDVAINGQTVLDDFDILANTAPRTALDREFPVSVSSGPLVITFTTVKDNAKVSAIQIAGGSGGGGGGGGDTTAPTIASTAPANGASTVPVNSSISMTFSEAMNQSVTQAAFGTSPTIAGAFSWNAAGTVMTFTPTANLAAGQFYYAGISTAATDLAGNALATQLVWNFTTAADGGDPELGQWVTLPSMPAARSEVGVVEAGGTIYVLGGGSPQGLSNSVFAYNPQSQTWTERAPYPGPAVDHAGAAAVNGIVYIIGGLTNWPSAAVDTLYAYNPATNTWEQKADLPRARGAMGVAVMGGKIYAAGGLVNGGTAVTDLTVYDPATDTWSTLSPMLTARDHLTAEAVGGKFYAMGGRPVDINSPRAMNEVYDPAANSWTTAAALPAARAGHGSAVLNGKIVIFGGEGNQNNPSGTFENTDEYDPASNSWRSLAPMITPRHGMDGAVYNNVIYVPGGGPNQGGSHSTTNEAFDLLGGSGMATRTAASVAFLVLFIGWFEINQRRKRST